MGVSLQTYLSVSRGQNWKSISEISSEYAVHPSQLVRWKNEAVQGLPRLLSDEGKTI